MEHARKDDDIVSAMSHACIIVAPVVGPALIWLFYKDKSERVRFQSFQALMYQLTMIAAQMSTFLLMATLWIFIIGMFLLPLFFFLWFFGIVYGLYAAYMTLMGKDFRYLAISGWTEKTLG